ncbi:MAG: DUF2399 domain-containing protein [Chloroflexi bacterium]|nr:DUF2399 domain-containing protein [Chloroflexota bacterium]
MSVGAAEAAAFVRREGLERVFALARARYLARGEARGRVRIAQPTAPERRILAELLGRKSKPGPITFTLEQLDASLRASTFGCSLAELLEALAGSTVVTHPEQRRLRQASQDTWRRELEDALAQVPEGSVARAWGQDRLPLFHRRHQDAPAATRRVARHAFALTLGALTRLPSQPPARLAVFAAEVAGDPHAFDRDRPAGQLLAAALFDLAGQDASRGRPTAEARAAVFERFGILVDTIWATVAVFNLARALTVEGVADPLVEAAGGRVLNLSARQLARWRAIEPACANVYAVENPPVFETLVDRLEAEGQMGPGYPTLLCTAGYLSQPARRLLDLLSAPDAGSGVTSAAASAGSEGAFAEPSVAASGEGITLWYSGDFDPDGLEIASAVLSRYPGRSRPWRLDVADYERAAESGVPAEEGRLRGLDRVTRWFPDLAAALRRHRVWVYQETLVDQLLGDVV